LLADSLQVSNTHAGGQATMDTGKITIEQFGRWFLNWRQRVKLVDALKDDLGCRDTEAQHSWDCCIAHQGLRNEKLLLVDVARKFLTSGTSPILSAGWWKAMKQPKVVTALAEKQR